MHCGEVSIRNLFITVNYSKNICQIAAIVLAPFKESRFLYALEYVSTVWQLQEMRAAGAILP